MILLDAVAREGEGRRWGIGYTHQHFAYFPLMNIILLVQRFVKLLVNSDKVLAISTVPVPSDLPASLPHPSSERNDFIFHITYITTLKKNHQFTTSLRESR